VVGVADGGFTTGEPADDRLIAARLAGQKPLWEPGAAYGYHGLVIGALTGEVVRRVTRRSIQELYEERIRAPYDLVLCENAFGHSGAAGSLGFADPASGVAYAYTRRRFAFPGRGSLAGQRPPGPGGAAGSGPRCVTRGLSDPG
jgi:CubicO group peptidase (beta-lactamase class C family)